MKIKSQKPTAEHQAFRDDMIALLKKHVGHLDAVDMLALGAHLVGQLIAMQDQRKYTRDMVMEIVLQNIERGNAEVFASLGKTEGSA